MQGTIQRNLFDRMGDAWRAFKALPTPAQLYPPQNMSGGGGPNWISWQGWPAYEAQAGGRDEQRVKKAVQSPSVFANMRAIATEFASSELIVKERKGQKLEDVDNHPLELLWEAPNPDMGRSFLMAFWAWSYTMTGKAYLYWLPAQGGIQEIWPIPPFMICAIPGRKNFIDGYAFKSRPDSEPVLIPREYITYSHSPNIFDIRDSLSFLVAGMVPVEMEIAMNMWNRNFFDESNGIPDGIIAMDKNALDTDIARVRMELRDFFGGTKRGVGVARAGDMEYHPWSRSQKEAEFTQGIELASKQIGRLMGFPDGYWSESANRANAEQARATMIAGAVWPLLVALHEDMNAGVVKRWWGDNLRAEFKDIRPEDRALKLQELQFYAQIETVNELRERIGSDALDDPRGEMFVVEIGKGTPIPATPAAEMTEEFVAAMEEEAAAEEEPPVEEGAEALPVEETTEDGLPIEEEAVAPEELPMPTKALDLTNWERKALKALKRFHAADVKFESNAIPFPEQVQIHASLKAAETVEDVRAAFERARVGAALEQAGLSVPSVPVAGQLTPAERDALAERLGAGTPLSEIVIEGREAKADVDDLLGGEWEGAMKWARRVQG